MPVMPREGVSTRARRAAQDEDEREEETPSAETSVREPDVSTSTEGNMSALFDMLRAMQAAQEKQMAAQEELRAEQRAAKEEQRAAQEKQMAAQEQQHAMLIALSKHIEKIEEVEKSVQSNTAEIGSHRIQLQDCQARIATVEEKIKNGVPSVTVPVQTSTCNNGSFKVPPFDGTSSWAAYKLQFEAVMRLNGWNQEQAKTALLLGLRDKALTVLEALGSSATYDQLMEALESRYGDAHLEHVYRAQLRDRCQRANESLQQWSLEVEKLVRKAYQSSPPALVDSMLLQAFVDGIYDAEVRAAVRLKHHEHVKEAVAHALEVEAVRRDPRSGRVREVTAIREDRESDRRSYVPRCFKCGERGHLRSGCPRRSLGTDAGVQASENQEN